MVRPTKIRKADRVAGDLLTRIVAGDLEVGELLPREAELALSFGVNRSVIREAIKLLEVHRLVRPVRRRGTEVLNPLASLSPEVIRAMLRPEPGRIDREVFADVLEIRQSLDIQMSTLAAQRHTPADDAAIAAVVDKIRGALNDPPHWDELGAELVLTIARAAHNRIFEMLVHWNNQVVLDLQDIFRSVRPPGQPHLQGSFVTRITC